MENGGEGEAKHGTAQEDGKEDLVKRELFVKSEHLQDKGVNPSAVAAVKFKTRANVENGGHKWRQRPNAPLII